MISGGFSGHKISSFCLFILYLVIYFPSTTSFYYDVVRRTQSYSFSNGLRTVKFKTYASNIFRSDRNNNLDIDMKLDKLSVAPINKITGKLTLPGSKSLSNRILLLAALSQGTTLIENLLDSADINYMLDALKDLGIDVIDDKNKKTAVIVGNGGPINVKSVSYTNISMKNGVTIN